MSRDILSLATGSTDRAWCKSGHSVLREVARTGTLLRLNFRRCFVLNKEAFGNLRSDFCSCAIRFQHFYLSMECAFDKEGLCLSGDILAPSSRLIRGRSRRRGGGKAQR